MSKKIDYICNLCGATSSNANKVIGFTHDGKSLSTHHPLKCDTHVCSDCLEQIVKIVDHQKGSQERAISP